GEVPAASHLTPVPGPPRSVVEEPAFEELQPARGLVAHTRPVDTVLRDGQFPGALPPAGHEATVAIGDRLPQALEITFSHVLPSLPVRRGQGAARRDQNAPAVGKGDGATVHETRCYPSNRPGRAVGRGGDAVTNVVADGDEGAIAMGDRAEAV